MAESLNSRFAGGGDAVSKYNIDKELAEIAKIKMPDNPALLPLMNRIIGFSKCRSDDGQADDDRFHEEIC